MALNLRNTDLNQCKSLQLVLVGQWGTADSDPTTATSTDHPDFRWTDIHLPTHAIGWCPASTAHRYVSSNVVTCAQPTGMSAQML